MKNVKSLFTGLSIISSSALFAQDAAIGNSTYNSPAAANSVYAQKSMANSEYNVSANMDNYQYNYQINQQPVRTPATNAYPNDDAITLKVNGLMNAEATNYVAVFNIEQIGLTAKSTDSTMNATI